MAALVRRKILKQQYEHGLGHHSREEIYQMGQEDLKAIAIFLGEKTYFLGEKPSSLDAVAFAFLANYLWDPCESPLKAHYQSYPQLEAYCRRMKAQYYPELT